VTLSQSKYTQTRTYMRSSQTLSRRSAGWQISMIALTAPSLHDLYFQHILHGARYPPHVVYSLAVNFFFPLRRISNFAIAAKTLSTGPRWPTFFQHSPVLYCSCSSRSTSASSFYGNFVYLTSKMVALRLAVRHLETRNKKILILCIQTTRGCRVYGLEPLLPWFAPL
jgi:hypothetical protein